MQTLLLFATIWLFAAATRPQQSNYNNNQYKRDNEPKLVSWKVLEGVTEPFDSYQPIDMPAWKQMKISADHKASNLLIQQALHEYGQLIRHPHIFGEMPMEERYDVFLSMAKLLKQMGFHQRAELLLYEAMSYSSSPHEAHLQLALLLLDRENVDMAKIHLKNCLFFRESDVILSKLQTKYDRLSQIINNADNGALPAMEAEDPAKPVPMTNKPFDLPEFYRWLEDLMARVFHGDLRLTAATTVEFYRMFSNLYEWITRGEMTGRFVFDLGQALYEGGRPHIGLSMMKRGLETSDAASEGIVSPEIVKMRLAIDFPVIPSSLLDIVDSYLNATNFLSDSSKDYVMIDMENVFDIYWSLPLLGWSGLPVWPVVSELMWRFSEGKDRSDEFSQVWLTHPITPNISIPKLYFPIVNHTELRLAAQSANKDTDSSTTDDEIDEEEAAYIQDLTNRAKATTAASDGTITQGMTTAGIGSNNGNNNPQLTSEGHLSSSSESAVGATSTAVVKALQDAIAGLVGMLTATGSGVSVTTTDPSATGTVGKLDGTAESTRNLQQQQQQQPPRQSTKATKTQQQQKQPKPAIHKPAPVAYNTLVEIGLFAGHMNSHPVGQMILHRVIDIASSSAAMGPNSPSGQLFRITLIALPLVPDEITSQIAAKVHRIVNLPMDTKSAWNMLEKLRLDILLFPDWQPFPDVQSALFQWKRLAPVQICVFVRGTSCSSTSIDYYLVPTEIENSYLNAIPAADSTSTVIVRGKTGSRSAMRQQIRPPWRELFAEQTVFLQWPLITNEVIKSVAYQVQKNGDTSSGSNNDNTKKKGGSGSDGHQQGLPSSVYTANVPLWEQQIMRNQNSKIAPLSEQEGQIFFEGQPVAIIAAHPTHVHPLMDDTIFKLMHAISTLQVVLVLPDAFFSHATDVRQRTCWSRKLVRRLWDRGGDLFHRIRLLPSSTNDYRLLQLLRQADMLLDSFPFGSSFHIISLALSVGTPVITLRSGVMHYTPPKDLREIKHIIQQHAPRHRSNPLYRQLLRGDDIPWGPSISSVAGWYGSVGLASKLVADNITMYAELASRLASNRELSYDLRVKILEIVDISGTYDNATDVTSQEYCGGGVGCTNDVARFLYNVGFPWASLRLKAVEPQTPVNSRGRHLDKQRVPSDVGTAAKATISQPSGNNKRRRRRGDGQSSSQNSSPLEADVAGGIA